MPRKGPAQKRESLADPLYHSALVTQFVNKLMLDGKRSTSQKVVYGALELISRKTGSDPLAVMRKAMDNVRPLLEVRSRRVGGASYQVPVEVPSRRSNTLAIRWIVANTRNRNEKSMRERFAGELMDAASGAGASVKKREDLHKMAEANKAFSHYRW
jgi:small subunit ribosomal protein S7